MVGFAVCTSDCVRVRCDRDVQERPCEGAMRPRQPQVYLLFILETLGKLGKNVWRSMAMQGLDPNRISTYVLGVLVLKRKAGFSFTGLIDTNPCLTCQLMSIFFSKAQRANHLTPHCLINAAPCKPTFSLPYACRGY